MGDKPTGCLAGAALTLPGRFPYVRTSAAGRAVGGDEYCGTRFRSSRREARSIGARPSNWDSVPHGPRPVPIGPGSLPGRDGTPNLASAPGRTAVPSHAVRPLMRAGLPARPNSGNAPRHSPVQSRCRSTRRPLRGHSGLQPPTRERQLAIRRPLRCGVRPPARVTVYLPGQMTLNLDTISPYPSDRGVFRSGALLAFMIKLRTTHLVKARG